MDPSPATLLSRRVVPPLPRPAVTFLLPLPSGSLLAFMEEGLADELLQELAQIDINIAKVTSAPASGTYTSLAQTISYSDHYVETFGALALFSLDKQVVMGETTVAEVEEALRKLKTFLENTNFLRLFSELDAAIDKKQVFIVLTLKVLAPLAGECVFSTEYQHICIKC